MDFVDIKVYYLKRKVKSCLIKTQAMKSTFHFLLALLFSTSIVAQNITPTNFDLTFNTGANMTLMFTSLSEYSGGVVGAFYDLNENGLIDEGYIYGSSHYTECIGLSTVIANNQAGLALWGDDSSISESVGLGFGVIPQFAILYEGQVIPIDLEDQFTGYTTNGVEVITYITIAVPTPNNAPEILEIPPSIEFVSGETVELSSAEDLWNDGVIYDSDNSLEELTFQININQNEIVLDWDNSSASNPIISAAPGFFGNSVIEFCISDFEATTCATNTILVYQTAISNEYNISPELFVNPLNTGSNMTLAVNSTQMDGYAGDTLGAFHDYNLDGVLECVGLYTIQEGFFGLPIWGNDSSTDEVDGLLAGQVPIFAILSANEVQVISPYPLFEGYVQNAISFVEEFYSPIVFELSSGWNMVGYVGSSDNTGIEQQVNSALGNGSSTGETFQVIKNVSGQFWSAAFAQINNFIPGEGYMMYVIGEATTLSFQSPSAYQPNIEYPLTAGWNMAAFTGDKNAENNIVLAMNAALENQATTEETFQVIKNVSGQFWSSAFAQINTFTPGEAYMMYVIGESTSINFQREIDNSPPAPGGGF